MDIFSIKFVSDALKSSPLQLVDVGSAGGVDVGIVFPKHPECFRAYGFEPDPTNFKKLRSDDKIRYFQIALSNQIEEKTFFHAGTTSALRPRNPGQDAISTLKTDTLESMITSKRIDGVDILKTDVEGHDIQVLKGMGPHSLENLLYVKSEFSFHAETGCEENTFSNIDHLLCSKGLFLYRFQNNVGAVGEISGGDVVYFRRVDYLIAHSKNRELLRTQLIKLLVICSSLLALPYGYTVATVGYEKGVFSEPEYQQLKDFFSAQIYLPRVLITNRFMVPLAHIFFMLSQLFFGSHFRAKSCPKDNRIQDYRRLFVRWPGLRKKSIQDLEFAKSYYIEKYVPESRLENR